MGERAAKVGALRVFEENVDKADTNLLQAGNFTACPTMTAIKKMAAEYREKHQLDLDYYNEIRLLSNALEAADISSEKLIGEKITYYRRSKFEVIVLIYFWLNHTSFDRECHAGQEYAESG
ncbi:unnamed protein product [Didymodactylos carnosus]|uniref:Uncharacterized protein n=1 Tax=Didymodactylos carnosus TaxID=1234261 RepID=A0A8S2WZ57_9BILA|nr:unnamed protein product [Didymodactylos carnosus]CAF3589173.1 unnamed protein product [Didymodactylos carnosus]CAF4470684.1 unnamed protein product [Didymodactylos carnosus]